MSEPGEQHAWDLLQGCAPEDVSRRSVATYSAPDRSYTLSVFGFPVQVDLSSRTMRAPEGTGAYLLGKLGHFARLAILRYLLHAQELSPTGRLLNPAGLRAGQFFLQGSHLLPLERVASRFQDDGSAFVRQAARFGGEERGYGDAAVELHPFPRLPITLILWLKDEEFPARADLLFDETCERQLPPDILWSVAMLCTLVMLTD